MRRRKKRKGKNERKEGLQKGNNHRAWIASNKTAVDED